MPLVNTHFDRLPDDCLLLIFNQVALQEMIRLRRVNSRWYQLVGVMCRGKHILKLFGSFRGMVDYTQRLKRYSQIEKDTDLVVANAESSELIIPKENLTDEVIGRLIQLFPNINAVVFFYLSWPSETKLLTLVRPVKKLKSLTLHGMPTASASQDAIWKMIKKQAHLKRLHMFATPRVVFPERVPILQKLEHFTLTNYKHKDIFPVLRQLGTACKCLLLDEVELSDEKLQAVFEAAPHLANSLTHLFLGSVYNPKPASTPRPQQFLHGRIANVWGDEILLDDLHRRGLNDELLHNIQVNILDIDGMEVAELTERNDGRIVAANSQRLLEYICRSCIALEYLDIGYMKNNSYETFKLQHILERLFELKNLRGLRLVLHSDDFNDELEAIRPLESIRHLRLELFPLPVERFLKVIPVLFPQIEHLNVQSCNQTTLKQLEVILAKSKPFKQLLYSKLYCQDDQLRYFTNLGFGEHYREYRLEQMGIMADLL